jgi:RHS repeat-associated protein
VVYYRFELRVLCFAFLKIYPETRNPKHETKNFCVYLRPNYHLDRIGSPIMITDESGNVVKEKKYEAFGNLIWAEGTHDDNREFTGKEKEPTGFHYFGARRYYGNIGRFLAPDPHTLMPEDLFLTGPQSLNPYVYSTNDPINRIDLGGLTDYSINVVRDYVGYMYGGYRDKMTVTADDKIILNHSFRVNSQANTSKDGKPYLSVPSDVKYAGVFQESNTFTKTNKGVPLYIANLDASDRGEGTKVSLTVVQPATGKNYKVLDAFHYGKESGGCVLFMSREDEKAFYSNFKDFDPEEDNIYIMFTEYSTPFQYAPADNTGRYFNPKTNLAGPCDEW